MAGDKETAPIQVIHLAPEKREEWNTFVAQEPSFALLQSWEWGDFKEKLGWKPYRIAVEQQGGFMAGAQMLIKCLPMGLFSIAYIPRGPVGHWLDETVMPLFLSALHRISRQHRAVLLNIEPPVLNDSIAAQVLRQHHFQEGAYANQPRATLVMDLTPDLDTILAQMHRTSRYNIRYASRKGVTVRYGGFEDLAKFHELMQVTGQRAGFTPRRFDYYKNEWEIFSALDQMRLFMACYQGKVLAVNMSAIFGKHAAYLHGASSGESSNLKPNYLLLWEVICWAKARGCSTLDLWGIPEEVGLAVQEGKAVPVTSRTDGLWGVYQFKRWFSEKVLVYAPAYEYTYAPLSWTLLGTKLFGVNGLDRIAAWMDAPRRNVGRAVTIK